MRVLVSTTTTSRSHLEGAPQEKGREAIRSTTRTSRRVRFFVVHQLDVGFLVGCFIFAVFPRGPKGSFEPRGTKS